MTTVEVAGLTFYGDDLRTRGVLQFTEFSSWYAVPDSKTPIRERPASDGPFGIDEDLRATMPLSLPGWGRAGSLEELYQFVGLFTAALRARRPVTVRVTDPLGSTTRTASIRNARPVIDELALRFTFSIEMLAEPSRYGPEQSVQTGTPTAGTGFVWPAVWPADWGSGGDPGRLVLTNTGTATTYPVLEVRGGLSQGVELVEITTGSFLRLERMIPESSTAVFTPRTGRVFLDDPANDISSFLTRRESAGFAIPAGASRTVQFNGLGTVSGSPILTARFAPAY